MAELKTKPTNARVEEFLDSIADDVQRADANTVLSLMKKITGLKPVMWGDSIVGFGSRHYKYATGREGDWFITGFSPRKQNLTIYIEDRIDQHEKLLAKLGKYKTSVSCLYIKKLSDVDMEVLTKLIEQSVANISG